MNRTLNRSQYSYIFGIPLLMLLSIILLAKSSIFQLHHKELSIGLTFDLILTVPGIYLLLIRKKNIPNISAAAFFTVGIIIASIVIPKSDQTVLTQIKLWLVPVIEGTIFFLIGKKIRKTIKSRQNKKSTKQDFYSMLNEASLSVVPGRFGSVVASEIAVICYGLFFWKRKTLRENEFTYHKNSGIVALLSAVIIMILVETVVTHFLLQTFSRPAAWLFTILGSYSAVQLFGIIRSFSKRPILIEGRELHLRYGIFKETSIQLSDIESFEISGRSLDPEKSEIKMSLLKNIEQHNFIIKVKNEHTITGFYGIKKTFNAIAFNVDEKERFAEELRCAISGIN